MPWWFQLALRNCWWTQRRVVGIVSWWQWIPIKSLLFLVVHLVSYIIKPTVPTTLLEFVVLRTHWMWPIFEPHHLPRLSMEELKHAYALINPSRYISKMWPIWNSCLRFVSQSRPVANASFLHLVTTSEATLGWKAAQAYSQAVAGITWRRRLTWT